MQKGIIERAPSASEFPVIKPLLKPGEINVWAYLNAKRPSLAEKSFEIRKNCAFS